MTRRRKHAEGLDQFYEELWRAIRATRFIPTVYAMHGYDGILIGVAKRAHVKHGGMFSPSLCSVNITMRTSYKVEQIATALECLQDALDHMDIPGNRFTEPTLHAIEGGKHAE